MIKCYNPDCVNTTKNKKFCSRSCAACVNNRLHPKRPASTKVWCACGGPKHASATQCNGCALAEYASKTLDEVCFTRQYKDLRSIYNSARAHARSCLRRANVPEVCAVCGYDRHVQCCHIRGLASFPGSATLAECNSLDNLVWLCPNHHWELDSGRLDLVPLPRVELGSSVS